MSTIWLADNLKKRLKEKKEDINAQLLNGVKSFEDYQFLRGRYNSLDDVEAELRELLKRIVEDDGEESTGT
jgi:hypothetical protein